HMTPKLDAGPALIQLRTPIGPSETTPELECRLAELGVNAVTEAVELLVKGNTSGIIQDSTRATKAPRLKKDDGLVNWSRSATEIFNQVRALEPWPKTFTFWKRPQGEPVRLILEQVEPIAAAGTLPNDKAAAAPASIVSADSGNLIIACGAGHLKIEALQ